MRNFKIFSRVVAFICYELLAYIGAYGLQALIDLFSRWLLCIKQSFVTGLLLICKPAAFVISAIKIFIAAHATVLGGLLCVGIVLLICISIAHIKHCKFIKQVNFIVKFLGLTCFDFLKNLFAHMLYVCRCWLWSLYAKETLSDALFKHTLRNLW